MKQTKIIMGMPVTIEIVDHARKSDLKEIFDFFRSVDKRFSTYKKNSEISKINRKEINIDQISAQMKKIFKLAQKTKQETKGFFDISRQGKIDPSGVVKGWAILEAAKILRRKGYQDFYVNVGSDIQFSGKNDQGEGWTVGIQNPFNQNQIVKVLKINNFGVATSGNYIRGHHIYDPKSDQRLADDVVSITVIGPDILEADRFATAAFAMGKEGIDFIEKLTGFEGYLIDKNGMATYTSGFNEFVR